MRADLINTWNMIGSVMGDVVRAKVRDLVEKAC